MGEKIRNKLQSEQGASLTMALLLFLVCMVVSSLLVTAATASAGRLSQMAEMDKRYYSVASAASMMTDKIDGCTVKITSTNPSSKMIVEGIDELPREVSYTKESGTWNKTVPTPGMEFQNFLETFLADQTVLLLDAETNRAALTNSEFVIQPKEGSYVDQLKVKLTVQWKNYPERGMLLKVENADGDGDVYSITLNCNADILEHRSIVADGRTSAEQTLYEVKWSVPQFDN